MIMYPVVSIMSCAVPEPVLPLPTGCLQSVVDRALSLVDLFVNYKSISYERNSRTYAPELST